MTWAVQQARIAKAKRLCRAACKVYGLKPTRGALESCELRPVRAAMCYRAVLQSLGRQA